MGGDASKDFKIIEKVDLSHVASTESNIKKLPWSLWRAVKGDKDKDNNDSFVTFDNEEDEYSVFDYGENYESFGNALKMLKSIRHPNIISLQKITKKSVDDNMLLTEAVEPVSNVLWKLGIHEVSSGLYDVVKAIIFLHNTADIAHNSIDVPSLFASHDGTWKIGCFESARKLNANKGNNTEMFDKDEKDFVDLLESLIDKLEHFDAEGLEILSRFHREIRHELLTSGHIDFNSCLSNKFFELEFVGVRIFLSELVVKTNEEKTVFFQSLISKLSMLPEELVASRLTVLFLQRFVLLDPTARKYFLPSFLTPSTIEGQGSSPHTPPDLTPVLEEHLFKSYVCPVLLKIFTIKETSIRIVLLDNFNRYYRCFDRQKLQHNILNQILLSARDTNDQLVELSLRALADLVTILGGDVIIGSQRLQRFYDGKIKELQVTNSMCNNGSNTGVTKVRELARRNSTDGLSGILKEEKSLPSSVNGKREKPKKSSLSNRLANQDVGAARKLKKYLEDQRDSYSDGESPSDTRCDPPKSNDPDTTEACHLEDDLVRSKSLESLIKNLSVSKLTKPIAIIEPKTIYRPSFGTEQNSDGNDSGRGIRSNDDCHDTSVDDEGGEKRSSACLGDKTEVVQIKIVLAGKDQGRNENKRTFANDKNDLKNATKIAKTLGRTVLDISKGALKIKPTPTSEISPSFKPDLQKLLLASSKFGDSGTTKAIIASPAPATEDQEEGSFSDWNDKWEDLEVLADFTDETPSVKCSAISKSFSIKTKHSGTKSVQSSGKDKAIFQTSNLSDHSTKKSTALNNPTKSKTVLRLSDMPLGFGYDVKLIEVKERSGTIEDDEWKLFADLNSPSEEKKNYRGRVGSTGKVWADDGGRSRADPGDSLKVLPSDGWKSPTTGWETEELDLNLD